MWLKRRLPWWAWLLWNSWVQLSEHPSLHRCRHSRSTPPQCLRGDVKADCQVLVTFSKDEAIFDTLLPIPALILTACGVSRLLMLSMSSPFSSSVRSSPSRIDGSLRTKLKRLTDQRANQIISPGLYRSQRLQQLTIQPAWRRRMRRIPAAYTSCQRPRRYARTGALAAHLYYTSGPLPRASRCYKPAKPTTQGVIIESLTRLNSLSCKHNSTYSFRFGKFVFTLDGFLWRNSSFW